MLHKLGDLAHDRGALAEAQTLFDDCLTIRRITGDQVGIAEALIGVGDVLLKQNSIDDAAECYGAALRLVEARGDLVDRAWAVRGLARVARAQGDNRRAWQLFAECLPLALAQANPWGIAACLDGLGGATSALGDLAIGAALFGAADRVRSDNQLYIATGVLPDLDQDRATTRAQIGDEAFEIALQQGMTASLDDVVAAALANIPEPSGTTTINHDPFGHPIPFVGRTKEMADITAPRDT